MADIFISYANEDTSRAKTLAKALEEQGWSVWWDKTIPPGKTFDQVIQDAIESARCVVVLWSKKSIKSDWVKEEANIGKERKILVPAKIDSVDLPLGFGRIQAADLTNWEAEKEHPGFLSLRNAISEVAGPPPVREKSVADTKLPESILEQQVKNKSEESETFQPDPSHLKSDPKELPINGPKAPRKIRLAFGIGAVALILVISVIGWFLLSKHTITASSDPNGSISPTGEVKVSYGGNQTFEITPNSGYHIKDVMVDGKSEGEVSNYAFNDVTGDHTISASFAPITYKIEASSGSNGSISPTGEVKVSYGGNQTFEITPDPCYRIEDIKVDNRSVGVESSYSFKDIIRNHEIKAIFSIKPTLALAAPENLALNNRAKASESSTRHTGADRAIDGNRDGNFKRFSVTHTESLLNSWWQVELPSPAIIESIVIWNRTDCCTRRLSNLHISVLNDSQKVWGTNFYGPIKGSVSKRFNVDPPVIGRFVKVQILGFNLEGNGTLSLAEVEVFGKFCK